MERRKGKSKLQVRNGHVVSERDIRHDALSGEALAASFTVGTDEERGIITVVYTCSECGDTNTERLFIDKPQPPALICVKCGAGKGIDDRDWGRTNHPGMWPINAEALKSISGSRAN